MSFFLFFVWLLCFQSFNLRIRNTSLVYSNYSLTIYTGCDQKKKGKKGGGVEYFKPYIYCRSIWRFIPSGDKVYSSFILKGFLDLPVFYIFYNNPNKCERCGRNCAPCKHMPYNDIHFREQIMLNTIEGYIKCKSASVIYSVYCKRCSKVLCVGQTGNTFISVCF